MTARTTATWWRQPVAWLGVAIFAASLAGCILMIVIAERYADEALPTVPGHVLNVPLARAAGPDGSAHPDRSASDRR
ncbi:MAG: hypothetical protein JSS46_05190 [Proteobacteria bacterium]|jgi:hypothetical protein|nr:hypothetical protein [Pseudomonadota bacterium]